MDSTTAPDATVPQPSVHVVDPNACELLLIRHGRSADVVPGSAESADPPLHPAGVEQVAALARRLQAVRLDAVHSSHLERARQTATALAEPRRLDVVVHTDLEEVRLGDWDRGEFRRRAAIADPEWLAWSRTGRWDGIPGGEGDDAFRSRVAAVIDGIAEDHRGLRVAIVCHGGVINAYLADLLGIERTMWTAVENTSVTVVHVGDSGYGVVTVNDTRHLYDVGGGG